MRLSILSFNLNDEVLFTPIPGVKHKYEFIGKVIDYGRESDTLVVEDMATGEKEICPIDRLEKLELN